MGKQCTVGRMIALFPSRSVAMNLFGFPVRWYGVLYAVAFLIGRWLLPRLQGYRGLGLSAAGWDRLLTAAILGVVLGGRLGFVFFYEPAYFMVHPWEIFAVWQGGMASHGGFIGVLLGLLWFVRRERVSLLALGDVIVVPVAIGLFCGRLGNFINQELYGTVTAVPWAVAIPGVEGLRHPTAVYAMIKDTVIALTCFSLLQRRLPHGVVAGVFLVQYALLRSIVELFRDQPYGYTDLGFLMLTRGQLLTVPIALLGAAVLWWAYARGR